MYRPNQDITASRRADELFDETARSVSLLEMADEQWPPLYKISTLLNAYSIHVGYPELIINPVDTDETDRKAEKYTAITVGRDDKFPNVYLWQVSLRQKQQRALLHGRSAKAGEAWQHISFDSQHSKSGEFIRGDAKLVTEFVLQVLLDGDVINRISQNAGNHKLASTGLKEMHSARKRKVESGAYAQIDQTDLPEWILDFLATPIDAVDVPGLS